MKLGQRLFENDAAEQHAGNPDMQTAQPYINPARPAGAFMPGSLLLPIVIHILTSHGNP
jgi:hypothetical protein